MNNMTDRFGNVPYVLFRNHGRVIAMTREDYDEARKIAAMCRCGDCDQCRAVEYHREATGSP